MSWDITVYAQATKEKAEAEKNESFMEEQESLIPFTEDQIKLIKDHLKLRGYKKGTSSYGQGFAHEDKSISARVTLTTNALYFNAQGDGIMEISMTAGEFAYVFGLKGHFAVYDSQNGGWQE